MSVIDPARKAVLDKLMSEHGLRPESFLFREVVRGTLIPTHMPGVFRLPANPNPAETVIDAYGPGYVVQASEVGAGLAFAESTRPNWQETMEMRTLKTERRSGGTTALDKVEVEVQLHDVFAQGGLLYPVESVTVERAWYCTLPSGVITVREAI